MLSGELKDAAKKVKRLEDALFALQDLWESAKAYMVAKQGKADEFVPEDIWEDSLEAALKNAKKFIK